MTQEEENNLLFKAVMTDMNVTGKLVAIYKDGYDTTAGFTKSIKQSNEPVRYKKEYSLFLPVDWHYKQWLFPDGNKGMLTINFNDYDKLIRTEDATEWDWVEEIL